VAALEPLRTDVSSKVSNELVAKDAVLVPDAVELST